MMIRNFLLVGFFVLVGLVSGCSGTGANDPAQAFLNESPHEIYKNGVDAMQDKSYAEAIKRFEALDIQYPYDRDTEKAQLYLIYLYYMKDEYVLAVSAADHFIRLHPTSPHVDYAYFMRGKAEYYQNMGVIERFFTVDLATRDLVQIQKSYQDFNEVVQRYPHSKYAPAAYQYLIYLRNVMADHELRVAQYYFNRKAYVAAANRASELVTQYQGAPATVDGLIIMIKSYQQLKLNKQEQDARALLKYNYPDVTVN